MISPLPHENCFIWNAHNGGIERILVCQDNLVVVTADMEEIKIWELVDYGSYEEKVSINLYENEKNYVFDIKWRWKFFGNFWDLPKTGNMEKIGIRMGLNLKLSSRLAHQLDGF